MNPLEGEFVEPKINTTVINSRLFYIKVCGYRLNYQQLAILFQIESYTLSNFPVVCFRVMTSVLLSRRQA
jgi:hypothetical protein